MKKSRLASLLIRIPLCALAVFLLFWFQLPPLNPRSNEFWSFLGSCIIVCVVINAFSQIAAFIKKISENSKQGVNELPPIKWRELGKPIIGAIVAVLAIGVFSIGASIVGSQFFNAASYNTLLTLEDGDFANDVSELQMSQIPVVDRDNAERLGKRKLGEMSDLVSQFEIADNYTQINYNNRPVRVTPLAYGDAIKWLNNQNEGLPAYITVDLTTQETTLQRLEQGIKYSESEYFMRNINRYLRFKYPTAIFDSVSFEIDDDGVPYWVASTVSYRIALWSGRDIGGAVLVNAVTGESQYYEADKIPQWVDQIYAAELVIEQLNYNGKYRSGFINSVFGQKGVLQPTDGYNYLAIDDDVWLYTGMTSVVSDESNVGFVLVNLRTKQSKYYTVPGAEEYSAMSSAEGQVQNLGYQATFPLLLNVSDRPTYFMALKDDAGLVKMYAFVDVEQYQVVGTGSSVNAAREAYILKLGEENVVEPVIQAPTMAQGKIAEIRSVVIEGNTKYYILLEGNSTVYIADISLSTRLPFAKVGDEVELTGEGGTDVINSIEFI